MSTDVNGHEVKDKRKKRALTLWIYEDERSLVETLKIETDVKVIEELKKTLVEKIHKMRDLYLSNKSA